MTAYYNEIDPFAAAWLRQLITAGAIAPGDVDERSITDVRPADLVGYRQVHFFAGIGGWSLAARLAGIPDDFPLWTGSAPCQPFSAAGKGRGTDDERHLWPTMHALVAECRPPIVAGEQVASRLGLDWLAAVRSDLEGSGYAVGASDLCAAGIGAPHIRQRLYWGAVRVADADQAGPCGHGRGSGNREGRRQESDRCGGTGGLDDGLADAGRVSHQRWAELGEQPGAAGQTQGAPWQRQRGRTDGSGSGDGYGLADAGRSGAHHGGWSDLDWLFCRDAKWRPVEPGTFPLADGVPARVGRLRGYGNAIVPQVAATFLRALMGAA